MCCAVLLYQTALFNCFYFLRKIIREKMYVMLLLWILVNATKVLNILSMWNTVYVWSTTQLGKSANARYVTKWLSAIIIIAKSAILIFAKDVSCLPTLSFMNTVQTILMSGIHLIIPRENGAVIVVEETMDLETSKIITFLLCNIYILFTLYSTCYLIITYRQLILYQEAFSCQILQHTVSYFWYLSFCNMPRSSKFKIAVPNLRY